MKNKIQQFKEQLTGGFLGFWVKKRRITFLLMALIIGLGLYSASDIPKESSPDIEFGIISVTTIYQGASPEDMDNLITEEIEQEIEDIDGIKKITSTSRVGVSSITIELQNDVDTSQALVDIKDKVDKVSLPSDAEDPIVTEISTDNTIMFDALLYGSTNKFSREYLLQQATRLKANLEGKETINKINIQGTNEYEIHVLIDKAYVEELGISLATIAQTIRAFNKNQPLGNHEIDSLQYDFRVQGELDDITALGNIPINLNDSVILLKDIATIQVDYPDDTINRLGFYEKSGFTFVGMTFNKRVGANIFQSADTAKALIQQELRKQAYDGLQVVYTNDLAEVIRTDYDNLATNGLLTIILVFIALFLFVGFKESLIASIAIPLAFFVTFFVLNQMGLSLNFLTNFSFIITFGIAIDTTIVIIEGASERMRMGFNPKQAVLLSVRDYKRPLIAGTSTTLVVFLPMLTLPGVTGKFLAYIPITIFITLLAALFISLTINSALFYKFNKPKKKYEAGILDDEYLGEDEKALLHEQRTHKQQLSHDQMSFREKTLDKLSHRYSSKLGKIMKNYKSRLISIAIPLGLLLLSFIIISPQLGFELFPSGDNPFLNATVSAKEGTTTETMKQYAAPIDDMLTDIPEIKIWNYKVNGNNINISVELLEKHDRRKQGLRDSFAVEKEINDKLDILTQYGLDISTQVQAGGPPAGSPVGIKLVTDSNEKFAALLEVGEDFEAFTQQLDGTKNVNNSSAESPGQFVFTFNEQKLGFLGLTPNDLLPDTYTALNGSNAGTLKGPYDNHDIIIMYDQFEEKVSPSDVMSLSVPTRQGPISIGDVARYDFTNAISEIRRIDTNITVEITAEAQEGITPDVLQQQLITYAAQYNFPEGISYIAGGEEQENADLIQATQIAFIIALLLIFTILVLMFNSYMQPAIIMFSVLMGILGANIGLRITGNPYSMAFGIGFIALTGIVVNDAIVFMDRANKNHARGMSVYDAIVEAGKSRLQPIILTTLTTIVGLMSIVREDVFFAGLAYTIMFGLLFASAATLFVIPALYHDKDNIRHIIKRTILSIILRMLPPFALIIALRIVGTVFNVGLLTMTNLMTALPIIGGIYLIAYIPYTIHARTKDGHTFIGKWLGIRYLNQNGELMNKGQAIRRFLWKYMLFVGPIILGMILGKIMGASAGMGIGALLLVIIFAIHVKKVWTKETNQTRHDQKAGTIVENQKLIED